MHSSPSDADIIAATAATAACPVDAATRTDAPVQPAAHYPAALRRLHWICAALLIVVLSTGLAVVHGLIDGESALGQTASSLHIGCAVLLLALMALRIALRLRRRRELPQPHGPAVVRGAARAMHVALYAAAALMPIGGYAMYQAYGGVPSVFGVALPDLSALLPASSDGALAGALWVMHSYGGRTLAVLVVLHICAGLYWSVRAPEAGLRRMWLRRVRTDSPPRR